MWYPREKKIILNAESLTNNSVRVFTNIFPLDGTGWVRLRMILSATVVAGTGTVPLEDGCYRYLKGITLKTSRGEVLLNNVPGMALYRLMAFLNHSVPVHDVVVLAGGTFKAVLDIPFCMPFLNRPEDTIFDSGRYSNLELQLSTGGASDFLQTVGTATVAVTLTLEIHNTMSALVNDGTGEPVALPYITVYPTVHADLQRYYDLESSLDLGLFGFYLYNHDASGIPFCPTAAGLDHLYDVTFKDVVRIWLDKNPQWSFNEERTKLLPYNPYQTPTGTGIPTTLVGTYPHFFLRNGSINECYPTGRKAQIRLEWQNATGTDETELCVFGMRALR